MKTTKLFKLLRTFSTDESRKFTEFLQSPFFNKSKLVKKFYSLIRISINNKNVPEPEKENLFKKLFTDEKYNDQKMRSLYSDLFKLCERFFVHYRSLREHLIESTLIIDELRERGQQELIDFPDFDEEEVKTECFKNCSLHTILLEKTKARNFGDLHKNSLGKNWFEIIKMIERYTVCLKLNAINNYIESRFPFREFFKEADTLFNSGKIINYIESDIEHIKTNDKILYAEYLIFKMLVQPALGDEMDLILQLLENNHTLWDIKFLSYIYYALNNFLINIELNGKDTKVMRFKINKFFEEINFFGRKASINGPIFFNVITTASQCRQYEFAKMFFEKYSSKLTFAHKNDILNICRAEILKCEGNLEESNKYFTNIKKVNGTLFLHAKVYLLRNYYELGEYDAIPYVADSAKHFLKRNRNDVPYYHSSYLGFFNFALRLNYPAEIKPGRALNLKNEILKTENLFCKAWLVRKAEEIIRRENAVIIAC